MLDYLGLALGVAIAFGGAWIVVRWRARSLGYAAGEYERPSPAPSSGDVLADLHARGQEVEQERTDAHRLASRQFTSHMFVIGIGVGVGLAAFGLASMSCAGTEAVTTTPLAVLGWFIIPEALWTSLHSDEKPETVIGRVAFRGGFFAGLAPVGATAAFLCGLPSGV